MHHPGEGGRGGPQSSSMDERSLTVPCPLRHPLEPAGSLECRPAVVVHGPARVVRHLPGVAVGVDEDSRVAAPKRRGAGAGDGRARLTSFGEHGVDFRGRADVVRQRYPSPAPPILDAAVTLELPAAQERNYESARLEEGDVIRLVVDAPIEAPAERLIEGLGPRHVADAERDQAQSLLHQPSPCSQFLLEPPYSGPKRRGVFASGPPMMIARVPHAGTERRGGTRMADPATDDATQGAATLEPAELELRLEQHRAELTGYCYRMLGSAFEADDAVQETLLRAWRSFDSFEGRAALRSWLYRIATNVCLDMLNGTQRRARPMDLGPARSADAPLPDPLPEATWIQPIPDSQVLPTSGDPAEVA